MNDAPMPLPAPLREPVAERDQRPRHPVGERARQQRHAEERQQYQRQNAPVLVGMHRPSAADRRKGRDQRKRQRHAEQQRQSALEERLVRAREDERQHRQDAGAEDRQHAAEIGEDEQGHGLVYAPQRGAVTAPTIASAWANSAGSILRPDAAAFSSSCSGRLAPTMAEATFGSRSTQASANCDSVQPASCGQRLQLLHRFEHGAARARHLMKPPMLSLAGARYPAAAWRRADICRSARPAPAATRRSAKCRSRRRAE